MSFHCVTCSDEGMPMTVLRIKDDLALCEDEDGAHHAVEIGLVEAGAGDQVLVHAGVALVTLAEGGAAPPPHPDHPAFR